MKAVELEKALTDWTVENSGYDEHRNYIGLSTIADCPKEIYRRFFNETHASRELRLRTRFTYEIEANLIERLRALGLYRKAETISVYDGLVQGNPDGRILEDLLEIKTIPLSEHIPRDRLPARVYWQCQAYMKYGSYPATLVIYLARETGCFKVFDICPNAMRMEIIDRKVQRLIQAVKTKTEPACECGRCK